MSHLSSEQLWAKAQGELSAAAKADVEAHLARCTECKASLAGVEASVSLLTQLPAPPPLPDDLARRVGTRLDQAFEAERQKASLWSWLPFLGPSRWALVLGGVAAMIAGLFVVTKEPAPRPSAPIARREEPAPVVPPPTVMPPPVAPAPPAPKVTPGPKLVARVASARKAKSGAGAVAARQELASGSAVSTEKGGSLWLQLPDGTRAGLTGATHVQLATLEPKALTLEVASGNLAMLVPHRQDRVLTVKAGDLSVKDLGTHFVVSREVNRVLVAVEEGSVEVSVPGRAQTLKAGQAADWHDGKLTILPWEMPSHAPTAAPAAPAAGTDSQARPEPEGDVAPPQQPESTAQAQPTAPLAPAAQPEPPPGTVPAPANNGQPDDGEWSQYPGQSAPPPATLQPLPPPPPARAHTVTPLPPIQPLQPLKPLPPPEPQEPFFSLRAVEEQVRQLQRQILSGFPTADASDREAMARRIGKLAESGACTVALRLADEWIAGKPGPLAQETSLRREVLTRKVGCLNRLGRTDEARAAQRLRDGQP